MDPTVIGMLLGIAVVATAGALVARARHRRRLPAPTDEVGRPYEYGWSPPPDRYSFAAYDERRRTDSPGEVAEQSEDWREAMAAVGARLQRHGVRRILLVHGTFVGDDPLAMVQQWSSLFERLDPRLAVAIRGLTKQQLDRLFKDAGNFSAQYAAFVEDALERKVSCNVFVWSSSNHHVARLRAARELVLELAAMSGASTSPPRVLLFGHSHAGQLFALVTHLLAQSRIGRDLLDLLVEGDAAEGARALTAALQQLRTVGLDFVTLGTPPRYGFCPDDPLRRVLHIVNHRGVEPRGGAIAGVLHTRGGDYVQQWGVAGSDLVAQNDADQRINERLDALLGGGAQAAVWRENVRTRPRVHRDGHTILVDYGDASAITPNFHSTGFGHAVYTTQRMLRFNLELVTSRLYP